MYYNYYYILLIFIIYHFSNNVLDATKAFTLVLTDPQDVRGLPETLLQMTAEAAAADTELRESRFLDFFVLYEN